MAGTGFYFVGPNQAFPEVQDAIEALISDQGSDTFATEQKIVIAENGVYAPFRLEPDCLRPDSAARLTIGSAQGIQAVISGRKNPAKATVGCLVGNNIPYVTVERMFFRDVKKGVVVGVNSHRPVINQCVFLQCGNVGAWIYEADEALIANSVFVNNEHGIAGINCRSIAIIHNTIFNDTGFTTKTPWLVYLDLQDDRGQGIEDVGQATLYNNILYAQGGGALLMYEKDVRSIISDHNDWWCPGGGPLVEIREGREDGTVHQDRVIRLDQWQLRSGQDMTSVSEEPGFIKAAADKKGASIDLKLLKVSSLIRKGKLLCGDPTNDLPTYFDDIVLCKDFNGKTRISKPTIGANEVNATNSFYGHSVFTDTDIDEDDALTCGDQFGAFDRSTSLYASAVPAWFPRVHAGYFYVRDIEYYLYAKKAAYKLEDFTRTAFPLSVELTKDALQVFVSGVDVTETATFDVAGFTFILHHNSLEVSDLSQEVELRGSYRRWLVADQRFETVQVRHRWHFKDGIQRYIFPTNPVEGAPVVVTDDLVGPLHQTGLSQEFSVKYIPDEDVTELVFHGPVNKWQNPEFAYYSDTFVPEEYEYTGEWVINAPEQRTSLRSPFIYGHTDWFGQRFQIDPEVPYVFSAHASVLEPGVTGSVGVSISFMDHEQRLISEEGPFELELVGDAGSQNEWTRFGMGIRSVPDTTPGRPGLDNYLSSVHTGLPIPTNAESMLIQIYPDTGIAMAFDCFQLEEGYGVSPYTRLPRGDDMTVEYETDDGGFYTVEDLTLHPVRNAANAGFLTVVPQPAAIFDADAPTDSTTLSDDWLAGRLETLPWARTSGYKKYRNVIEPNLTRELTQPELVVPSIPPAPTMVRVTPGSLTARQGSEGEIFAVEVFDQNSNAYPFDRVNAWVTDTTGEFPGYLARQEWGYYTQLGQQVQAQLNEAGAQIFLWIPPEQEDVEYRGNVPTTTNGVGFVDTYYRVYPPNHGSPVVRDQFGTLVPSYGEPFTGWFTPAHGNGLSYADLTGKYPIPGSMTVLSDDVFLEETFQNPPDGGQFYVDYENAKVTVRGDPDSLQIGYTPRTIWRDNRFPRRFYISEYLADQVVGDMSIQYDALVNLVVQVPQPTGISELTDNPVVLVSDLIAQHNDR